MKKAVELIFNSLFISIEFVSISLRNNEHLSHREYLWRY